MEAVSLTVGIIDTITELAGKAATIAKKKNDMEFMSTVVEIQTQIIELKQQNELLIKKLDLSDKILRHSDGLYVTLKDDPNNIRYCSTCWGRDGKLVQIGSHQCNVCHTALLGYKDDIEEIKQDAKRPIVL